MRLVPAYSDDVTRYRSRTFTLTGLALAATLLALPADAQQTRADSLAERLRRAEAAIEMLQTQVAEQAQSAVQTRSRMRLELDGRILMNAFANTRRVNNVDNPQFVLADPAAGVPMRGAGIAMRQSRLGLALTGARALGGEFSGDVDVDFYGGQLPSGGGRTFPVLRLRTARGIVRWSRAQLMIGQESPLISDVDPLSIAAVGSPAFAAAGNLWLWLPQVRVGYEHPGLVRVGAQGAVLAPTSGDPAAPFDTDNDLAERAMRPYLEGRVFAAWGEEERGEIGCGAHQGWLVPTTDRESTSAFACDLVAPLISWLELRGEWFRGQALRGLGGGGIGQNFSPANEPLRTTGGWGQLNLRPSGLFGLGAGCGVDHPEPAAARRRNDVCAAYASLRPHGPVFIGVEYRWMRTEFPSGRYVNDYVTLGSGFGF
jgi:hypothetical protein